MSSESSRTVTRSSVVDMVQYGREDILSVTFRTVLNDQSERVHESAGLHRNCSPTHSLTHRQLKYSRSHNNTSAVEQGVRTNSCNDVIHICVPSSVLQDQTPSFSGDKLLH